MAPDELIREHRKLVESMANQLAQANQQVIDREQSISKLKAQRRIFIAAAIAINLFTIWVLK